LGNEQANQSQYKFNNLRNIIALQDLGEAQLSGLSDNEVVVLDPSTGILTIPLIPQQITP
jgi:hypothetical protein